MPVKYLNNLWKSLEMPLINCKVELKFTWANHCHLSVLYAANADNDDGDNSQNIIFTVKYTKLYIPIVILIAKDNQKLSKFLSKEFEISV